MQVLAPLQGDSTGESGTLTPSDSSGKPACVPQALAVCTHAACATGRYGPLLPNREAMAVRR